MSVLPSKFNAYILNNSTTRVADVYEAKPPTNVVIAQNKNLPSPGTLNQQACAFLFPQDMPLISCYLKWEVHVVHSGHELKATFKAYQPESSYAIAEVSLYTTSFYST